VGGSFSFCFVFVSVDGGGDVAGLASLVGLVVFFLVVVVVVG
jgi:hypothetical protein